MLSALEDADESVAMESCDFWQVLLDHGQDMEAAVTSQLPGLIPRLMRAMRLSEEQLQQERDDEEQEATGEKKLNFKPVHHRGERSQADDGETSQWYLRKAAALLLDNIATAFPEAVSPCALPTTFAQMQSADVWEREAGMLALGALSTGCLNEMTPHLPQIFPFLLQVFSSASSSSMAFQLFVSLLSANKLFSPFPSLRVCFLKNLSDAVPEVRCISCWTVSRYCTWLFDGAGQGADEDALSALFEATLRALLVTMADPRPKVGMQTRPTPRSGDERR